MNNVVLLTVDALRKDAFKDQSRFTLTPFLDSLQDHTIQFTNAHSSGPYTQAAFPGILTSSYYLEYGRQKMLSGKRLLISEVLQKAGIETAGFHSNAYLSGFFGWNRGWDYFYDSMEEDVDEKIPYIKADALNQKIAGWLYEQKNNQKPFFLWLHYMDVHEPYMPERKSIQALDPSIAFTEEQMFSCFTDVLLKRDISDSRRIELLKKLYLAQVIELDQAIKEFFAMLRHAGYSKDTVVIITSDHGDEFNEHGGLSHDGKMFSELIRVPLLIYDPSLGKPEGCDKLVSTVDLPPTILHLFGLEPAEQFEGHSLLPLEDYPNKGVYGEAFEKFGSRESGQEKEIYYYREDDLKIMYRETDEAWSLYDLKADPMESENIFNSCSYAAHMKEKLHLRIKRYVS